MRNLIIVVLVVLVACNSQKKVSFKPDFINAPPTIIYKTKVNYNNLVPIILSDDKSEVISYPYPSDLAVGNAFALPTALKNGYLLDNRGIGKNVAFLKLTYKEYSKLGNAPNLKELFELIIDKDPLIEMWNCGNARAFSNKEKQIIEIIRMKKWKNFLSVLNNFCSELANKPNIRLGLLFHFILPTNFMNDAKFEWHSSLFYYFALFCVAYRNLS